MRHLSLKDKNKLVEPLTGKDIRMIREQARLTQIHDFPPKIAENVYVQKCDMINYNVLRLPTARKVVCSARK
jgi:hypothetical protein